MLYALLLVFAVSNQVRDGTFAIHWRLVLDVLVTIGLFRATGLFWVPNRILRGYAVLRLALDVLAVALDAYLDGLGEHGLVPLLSASLLATAIAMGLLFPPVSSRRQVAAFAVWLIGFLHGALRFPILP